MTVTMRTTPLTFREAIRFAEDLRDQGASALEAAVEAARGCSPLVASQLLHSTLVSASTRRAFREEAARAGDLRTVAICDRTNAMARALVAKKIVDAAVRGM